MFPYTESMRTYLQATNRGFVAEEADKYGETLLRADPGAKYDQVIQLNLSELEPHISQCPSPSFFTAQQGIDFFFSFFLLD